MGLRKTFDDYSDQKIYDKVEDRKNELVCRWRAGERLPLIRVSEQKGTEENWLETLRVQCDSNENMTDIVEFSTDPPYVILRTPKGKKTFCGAICVEYFRLHEIADKGTAFRRYTYFEMYYDDKVIACLMELPFFERRGNMDKLQMDEQEWMNSKRQMQEFWKLFLPEAEEIEAENLPENFLQRMAFYKENRRKCNFSGIYPNAKSERLVWPLATFLISLQLMPVLPQMMIPQYLVNYVCQDDEDAKNTSERLQLWLKGFLQKDPIVEGEIEFGPAVQQQSNISNPCTVRPYIQMDTKRVQQKTVEKMQESLGRKADWKEFPFGIRVPVLISTDEILSSAVLNIVVDDPQELPDRADDLWSGFQYGLGNWCRKFPDETYAQEEWAHQWKRALRASAKETRKGLEPDRQSRTGYFGYEKSFQLSINFLTLYGRKKDVEDLPEAGAEWAIQQRELWGEKTQRIEDVVEILLSKLRESCQVTPTMNPTEDSIPEGGGRKTVNNEELLIFKYADFKKLIEEKYPKVFYGDLREKLCEMGVMICHKKKPYYTINIGGKATNTAAFSVKKLME